MNAVIEIRFLGGTDIQVAVGEAKTISKRLGVNISFKFNGVDCFCPVDSKIDFNEGVSNYFTGLRGTSHHALI